MARQTIAIDLLQDTFGLWTASVRLSVGGFSTTKRTRVEAVRGLFAALASEQLLGEIIDDAIKAAEPRQEQPQAKQRHPAVGETYSIWPLSRIVGRCYINNDSEDDWTPTGKPYPTLIDSMQPWDHEEFVALVAGETTYNDRQYYVVRIDKKDGNLSWFVLAQDIRFVTGNGTATEPLGILQ